MKITKLRANPRRKRRKFSRVKPRAGKTKGHLRRRPRSPSRRRKRAARPRDEWVIVAVARSRHTGVEYEYYWGGHSFIESYRNAVRFKSRKAAITKMESMRDRLPANIRGLNVVRAKTR